MFKFNRSVKAITLRTLDKSLNSRFNKLVAQKVKEGTPLNLYKFSNLTCFQDSACSIPATVDGVVGGVIDAMGGANKATQGTAGFKPILRKGAVNLLLNSGDLSAINWLGNTTVSGGKILDTVVNTQHGRNQVFATGNGLTFTFQVKLKQAEYFNVMLDFTDQTTGDASAKFNLQTGTFGSLSAGGSWTNVSATMTLQSDGYYLCSITATKGAGTNIVPVIYLLDNSGNFTFAGTGASGVFAKEPMLSLGSTVPPYVPTTTAPASNGIGNYWLDFGGVQQYLQLSSVPFQMSDDSFVSIGAKLTSGGASKIIYVQSANGSGESLPEVSFNAGNNAGYYAAGGGTALSSFSGPYLGTPIVLSEKTNGTTVNPRINGAISGTATKVGTYTTATLATIGCVTRLSVNTNYFKGAIYSMCIIKGTLTDKEALLIEKYLAKLTDGVTI